MTATSPRSPHPALRSLVLLLALAMSGCAPGPPDPSSRTSSERAVDPSGVLPVLRSQGVGRCRGLVSYWAPGAGSRRAILRRIARDLDARSSDPADIAALVGRDLAGPSAGEEPVHAASEGCLLGLRQGLQGLPR